MKLAPSAILVLSLLSFTDTFTVENAGSSLLFSGDQSLTSPAPVRSEQTEPVARAIQLLPTRINTKTVYGFLDFTTTVSNTVMIFKPSKASGEKKKSAISATALAQLTPSISQTKPAVVVASVVKSELKIQTTAPTVEYTSALSSPQEEQEAVTDRDILTSGRDARMRSPSDNIEGSIVNLSEMSSQVTKPLNADRARSASIPELKGGTGFILSTFPIIDQQAANSKNVATAKIAAIANVKSRTTQSQALPTPIEVSAQVDLSGQSKSDKPSLLQPSPSVHPSDIISKTASTLIKDGLTTVHETTIIATTIKGRYAHLVQTTSRVFKDSITSTIAPSLVARGSVEVVTDLPAIKTISTPSSTNNNNNPISNNKAASTTTQTPTTAHTTEAKQLTKDEEDVSTEVFPVENPMPLPSLESLFESVGTVNRKKDTGLQRTPSETKQNYKGAASQTVRPSSVVVAAKEQEHTPAPLIRPSFLNSSPSNTESRRVTPSTRQLSTYTPQSNMERRAGLASTSRPRATENAAAVLGTRPPRRENRWRYTPPAKPKVDILRQEQQSRPGIHSQHNHDNSQFQSFAGDHSDHSPVRKDEEDIDPTEVRTLRVQTTTVSGYSNFYYELATIKSPYVMRLGTVRNTRYVTLTKTFTRRITQTAAPADIGQYDGGAEILLDPSLPLPENILATTAPYENILKDSSDTATLPAIIVAATESEAVSLQTVTETFSTTELMMKTSILPYLKAGQTSFMTLTQSYFITRVITAVKTVPPADLYQFIPSKTLTDISTNLQEAGSEHNEHLLPGELEFSDNDEFSEDDGPKERRVPAPPEFLDHDLSSIGSDFDVSSMDKNIDLQPSLVSPEDYATAADDAAKRATPPLPFLNFNNKGIDGARLPFGYPAIPGFPGMPAAAAAADRGAVQVVQTSRPVVKTSDIIQTEVLPIWDGAKTFYSTITRSRGTTVVTETEYGTTTVSLATINPFQQFTVVSSPVVTDTVTTSTELRIYRIIFRAQTTYTTVTSTTVFPTQLYILKIKVGSKLYMTKLIYTTFNPSNDNRYHYTTCNRKIRVNLCFDFCKKKISVSNF
nr:EOG090X017N [Leptodora kindtii]